MTRIYPFDRMASGLGPGPLGRLVELKALLSPPATQRIVESKLYALHRLTLKQLTCTAQRREGK